MRVNLVRRIYRRDSHAPGMNPFWSHKTIFERCEFVAAIILTIILVVFHMIFFFHAGPLWRDEISSLALATKPDFAQFWKSLPLDPFPASYFLLLRFWNAIGLGGSDVALRSLGLIIGVAIIGVLWGSAYLIDKSTPLWSLALFSFNPLTLENGDSLRPYGLGLIWVPLVFAVFWRMIRTKFENRAAFVALIAAILSVQALFTNAFVLFALGLGAIFVLLTRKQWASIAVIISIGLIAGLTLLPYLPIMRATAEWSKIIANRNDLIAVLTVARDAVADAGTISCWTWLALIIVLLATLLVALWPRRGAPLDSEREAIIFAGGTFVIAAIATIGFLCLAHYLVFPRYFLPVMCIGTLSAHLFWSAFRNRLVIRALSSILALLVAVLSLSPLAARAAMRMTNCDQIAAAIEKRASHDDLIIVTSFLYGVTFQRYYHGPAEWVAVPQVPDFSLHRWDLLKEAISQPDPMPELVVRAEDVLRNGHKIFLVGKLGPALPEQPQPLPPAPQSEFAWQMEPYLAQWKAELTYWIEHHALHGGEISIERSQSVNSLESLGGFEVSGWREASQ